jgi:small subunit ribosomal protein S17
MSKQRAARRLVVGIVISDKMDKTIRVREDWRVQHPLYGKYVRRSSIYKVHDEANEAREGDQVEITHSRPVSKTKHWRLVRVIRRAEVIPPKGGVDQEQVLAETTRPKIAPPAPREEPAAAEEEASS